MELKFLSATPDELKAAIGETVPDGYIAGWASTDGLDSYRDVVIPGAFDESIKQRGLTGPTGVKLLLNHNWQQLAGVIKVLETRGGRLWIEAQMELGISYVEDMYLAIKAVGGISFSIGFFLQEYNIRQDAQDRDYFELVKGDLFEVSIVPFPANDECVMEFVKSTEIVLTQLGLPEGNEDTGAIETIADFEKMLVNSGVVKSRNDARLITLEVKQVAHLFATKNTPATEKELEPERTAASPVDDDVFGKALKSISAMKSMFSPKT